MLFANAAVELTQTRRFRAAARARAADGGTARFFVIVPFSFYLEGRLCGRRRRGRRPTAKAKAARTPIGWCGRGGGVFGFLGRLGALPLVLVSNSWGGAKKSNARAAVASAASWRPLASSTASQAAAPARGGPRPPSSPAPPSCTARGQHAARLREGGERVFTATLVLTALSALLYTRDEDARRAAWPAPRVCKRAASSAAFRPAIST